MSNGMGGQQNKVGIGIPVSRIETIANQRIDFDKVGFISDYEPSKIDNYLLHRGDILFSHINSPPHLGKTAIYKDEAPLYHGINLLRIIVNQNLVSPEFFNYFCNLTRFQGLFAMRAQHAVNQSSINQTKLGGFEFQLAPPNEQRRIADKLDALLARIDACRDRLDRLPGIIKQFRQSVLAAATSGKLTEDWRDSKNCPFNWQARTIQEVALVGTGSTPLRSRSDYFAATGIPWITSAATGQPFVHKASEFVTEKAITDHRLKKYPIGTLLIAMYGEGKTRGQVTELKMEATINQACAALVVNEELINSRFVKLVLQSNYLAMRDLAEGGNQPNLNLSKIKTFKFLLPAQDEQHEIVLRVECLFALADRLEARLSAARAKVDTLTPASLAKAFRGELVPQDLNDEHASVLLERIRAERAASTNPQSRRGLLATA